MKSKSVTVLIILALVSLTVVTFEKASSQTHKRTPKRKATIDRKPPTAEAESAEEAEVKRQIDELRALPADRSRELELTIDLLRRVSRKTQLAGIPKYFLSEDYVGESGRLEGAIRKCRVFLPDGIMSRSLQASFQALLDAWALDRAEKTGIVSDLDLRIIDRYKLQDKSLYLLTRDVLNIAQANAEVAAEMFDMVKGTSRSP